MVPKLLISIVLGISFGINFICVSQLPGNSYFVTLLMPSACFCFSRPPILASKIHPKIMVFPRHPPRHPFFDFMLTLYENDRFWDRFKNQRAPTCLQKSMWRQIVSPGSFFVRDLFLRSSLGTPLAPFGPMLAFIRFSCGPNSYSILFNFAFHWARFGNAFPSKLRLVEIGRRNSQRERNNFA